MNKPNLIIDMWEFHWGSMTQYNSVEGKWYKVRWNEDTQEIQYYINQDKWHSYRYSQSVSESISQQIHTSYKAFQEELEKILLGSNTNE